MNRINWSCTKPKWLFWIRKVRKEGWQVWKNFGTRLIVIWTFFISPRPCDISININFTEINTATTQTHIGSKCVQNYLDLVCSGVLWSQYEMEPVQVLKVSCPLRSLSPKTFYNICSRISPGCHKHFWVRNGRECFLFAHVPGVVKMVTKMVKWCNLLCH